MANHKYEEFKKRLLGKVNPQATPVDNLREEARKRRNGHQRRVV